MQSNPTSQKDLVFSSQEKLPPHSHNPQAGYGSLDLTVPSLTLSLVPLRNP